ncbi:pyridoxamine 5'-phosphate oxidase family protein [Aestuariirhabdus sp. Z084]|uniref:pyridoxamine 5'-phosphate oxidase family protein n=1 Tax=Aestuariirhabdus haliotis TaxID=2918751 RepID=UPI00201B43DD|nr:pyridoxamine 5'-phosphate oxidase family protein [Aestuariirhabdus haliotis]MCL6417770.1 pyridoxamine 5'-phosphate oxidase family protein [Aestuariirhabdus haliotis]MCL6421699.1 pyridoxamine 5'-phosphate oxidase family protein [Aestuariirhabdus haliotis]
MGRQYSELSDKHQAFIGEQKIFFVGTAVDSGQVNVSPKGGDSLRVIDPTTIAWMNLTGSGNESASHVIQNPRMTLMFCAFEGPPVILRAYGTARVLHRADAEWERLSSLFPPSPAARQIFVLDINLVQSSCGMSVPYYDYKADREDLDKWSQRQGPDGIEKYWVTRNQRSIDGFETEIIERAGLDKDPG